MLNDNQKLDKILTLLPEKDMRDLLDELSNGYFSEKYAQNLIHDAVV